MSRNGSVAVEQPDDNTRHCDRDFPRAGKMQVAHAVGLSEAHHGNHKRRELGFQSWERQGERGAARSTTVALILQPYRRIRRRARRVRTLAGALDSFRHLSAAKVRGRCLALSPESGVARDDHLDIDTVSVVAWVYHRIATPSLFRACLSGSR